MLLIKKTALTRASTFNIVRDYQKDKTNQESKPLYNKVRTKNKLDPTQEGEETPKL